MRRAGAFLTVVLCGAVPAAAQENNDLNLIPGTVQAAPAPEAAPKAQSHGKFSLDDAFGYSTYRGTLAVPAPYGIGSRWSDRADFDAFDQWTLSPKLTATFSDRLSATFADGVGFPKDAVRNDLREAYMTYEVAPETYLEAGRINLRNGVSFGYNPTDYLRARTTVAQSSADPGAQRLNRLGTVMVRAQRIFSGGSFDVAYAPKLHKQLPIGTVPWALDPKIDQTNGSDRLLATFSFELEEFSPQLLLFHDRGRTQIGLNISHTIGGSVIAYASWSGGVAPNLIVDAIAFGKKTGTLPAFVPVLPATSSAKTFKNDLSVGGSWTGEDKESVSLEYDFHEAGLSRADWRNWFAVGANPVYASEMWYIRGFASDVQQPETQHQAFVRVDWSEPFHIQHADINGFVMTNLADGSLFGQLSAWYDLSDNWSAGFFFGSNLGSAKSEWGSLRGQTTTTVQLVRYL